MNLYKKSARLIIIVMCVVSSYAVEASSPYKTMDSVGAAEMGFNAAVLTTDLFVALGQGEFLIRGSELCSRIKNIKAVWPYIDRSRELGCSFVYGMSTAIAALNVDDFIKKAKLTQRQAELVRVVYAEVCDLFNVMSKIDQKEWADFYESWGLTHSWLALLVMSYPDVRQWLELIR